MMILGWMFVGVMDVCWSELGDLKKKKKKKKKFNIPNVFDIPHVGK
jgi:hypothetical protein